MNEPKLPTFEVRIINSSGNAKPKDFYDNSQRIQASNWKQAVRQAVRSVTKSGRWQIIKLEVTKL